MNIKDIITESHQACPHCGGPLVEYSGLMEKKDACYYKVKASAKVWPSAYASGRLVQCRKKGAGNYGNKSEGMAEDSEDTVSFREMVDVVDKHYPKYYAELSGSNISDKQFEQKITSAYKKIMQKQGVAEKLGDLRPKLGSSRDRGKSVRKWRQARGLDESGVAEASNELAAMTTMGMGNPLDFSSDYALYTVQKGRELFGTMRNLYAKANALPPAERSKFYQRLDALAYEGLGDEILRYSKTLTVDDLVAITDVLENYDIMFNTIAIPDELKDAEAAWKQYAAEVALARTQAQPGQTMHEQQSQKVFKK